jgi:hypothetical protein
MAVLVVILLVATFFRTHLFEAAPPGLQHDEIFKANFALDILDGRWPVFFDANGGEEALFPYLAALSISIFGHNFFALRLVSFVCGILSILFSYLLIKQLFGPRMALLTAAGLAVSFWHIFDSRVALRPITLLLIAVASFHFFWLGLKRGRTVWFVVAGVFLGGAFYSYTSGLLIPITVILFLLLYQLPVDRTLLSKRWRGILLAFVIALIVFLPMGYHVYAHPLASTARARDLSDHINLLLAGDPAPLLRDVGNVLGMFVLRGDPEWRYNLADRPVFDPLTFALFCGGVVICLARIRRREYAFLFIWLCVNMAPSALTRQSPSSLRAIGSLTAIYALPSLSIDVAWGWATRRFGAVGRRVLVATLILLFASSGVFAYRDYFTVWAQNEEVRSIYRADLSAVARYLDQSVGDEVVCVSAAFAADLDQQILRFMLQEPRSIRFFDGRQTLVFPDLRPSDQVLYIFPATCPLRDELMGRFFADLPVAESVVGPQGEPAFVAYRLDSEEVTRLREVQPRYQASVILEDRVQLLGYDLPSTVAAGDDLPLLVYWRVYQPIRPDLLYAFFAHLVDMRGYVWAEANALGYPVSGWIQGDQVVQWFDLAVPPDAPPLDYQVKMGMFDLTTGVRLTPRIGDVTLPDDVVSTEPFHVARSATPPNPAQLVIQRVREASFDGKLKLLGCDLSSTRVDPGDKVLISLYWQALMESQTDYVISVFVTDDNGDVLQEVEHQPVDGAYPTSSWREGDIVRDRFDLTISQSAPVGKHTLWVRVYDPKTGTYLAVQGSQEERVRLSRIRILEQSAASTSVTTASGSGSGQR